MCSPKLVLLLCLTALAVEAGSNDNLVAVVQLIRHGQRTPVNFYPTDSYQDKSNWANLANGQLTNEGKRQHFALGQFTRTRYADWLPSKYNKDDIYVQSTDVDRTLQSALSNIYGMYPATGNSVWRKNVDWQPIPIHPVDSKVLPVSSPDCAAYDTERNNVLATDPTLLELDTIYQELYAYLTNHSGINVTTFPNVYSIYDCLKIKSDVGYTLPSWASTVYPEPLETLVGYYFKTYSYNTKLKRLGIGPLFNAWISYFDQMIEDPTSNPKYQLYSGHDFNIACVLNTLGAFESPYQPEFAATVYLELRKNTYGSYYVNAWHKDGDDFEQLSINGCALDCPLSELKSLFKDILVDPDTRDSEC